MKKFICLLLSVFAVLSFSACGETGGSNTDVTTGTFEYELVTVENDSGEEDVSFKTSYCTLGCDRCV